MRYARNTNQTQKTLQEQEEKRQRQKNSAMEQEAPTESENGEEWYAPREVVIELQTDAERAAQMPGNLIRRDPPSQKNPTN